MQLHLGIVDIVVLLSNVHLLSMLALLYFNDPSSRVNRSMALFLLLLFLFLTCNVLVVVLRLVPAWLYAISIPLSCFAGLAFYRFSQVLVNNRYRFGKYEKAWFFSGFYFFFYTAYLFFEPSEFSRLLTSGVVDETLVRPYSTDISYKLYVLYWLSGFVAGTVILFRGYKNETDQINRNRIRNVLIGILVGVFSVVLFMNIFAFFGLYEYGYLGALGIVAGLTIIGFSVVSSKAWKAERKLAQDRIRISRELHDQVGSELSASLLQLENSSKDISLLEDVSVSIRKCLDDLRDLVFVLNQEEKLGEALEEQMQKSVQRIAKLSKYQIKADITRIGPDLDDNMALQVLRVFSEVLTNIIRHARASMILIRWRWVKGRAILTMADNGRGLPPDIAATFNRGNIEALPGMGLKNIHNRVSKVGSRSRIFARGSGTVFCFVLNLKSANMSAKPAVKNIV